MLKKAPTAAKLFYPPTFLFLDYLLKYASLNRIEKAGSITLRKTREGIKEELGMTVKTINRTIAKLKEGRKKISHHRDVRFFSL